MRRANRILLLSIIAIFQLYINSAQDMIDLPAVGDVPVIERIEVTSDDDDPTTAIVTGGEGAVFPNAFVVIQNRYTADRDITSATSNGNFTASLYGQKQTPYWIATFQRFPSDAEIESALGVTVYGTGEPDTLYIESDLGGNVPHYRISGTYQENPDTVSLSLTFSLDVTDSFPQVDNLSYQIQLRYQQADSLSSDVWTQIISPRMITRNENQQQFTTEFEIDPQAGIPVLLAYVRAGDGEWQRWEDSALFALQGQMVPAFTLQLSITFGELMPDTFAWQATLNGTQSRILSPQQLAIMPPDTYTLQLNQASGLAVSMLPLSWGGELSVTIQRPSGKTDTFETTILQRVDTLDQSMSGFSLNDPAVMQYTFDDYGDYMIQLVLNLSMGDTTIAYSDQYDLRIAELLTVSPSLLPSTPLQVGDVLSLGAHVIPPLPAQVSITAELPAIDVRQFSTQANRYGYATLPPITLENIGRYYLTYTATYEDAQGRLWSSEPLSVYGIVADRELTTALYGQRGLAGYGGVQQAWFDTTVFPDDDRNAGRQPYFPFYAGDVAFVPDAPDGGIAPALSLPSDLADDVIAYASVVSPNGIFLQTDGLSTTIDLAGDDTFTERIGTGVDGVRAGDYALLFGGGLGDTWNALYASLLVVTDDDAPARVVSPFLDQLTLFGQTVELFFLPTDVRPAQVLEMGASLSLTGQLVPPLPADIAFTVTSPSGVRAYFDANANAIGYVSIPDAPVTLDEIGIWTVDVAMRYQGGTSAGQLTRPYPQASLSYPVFVVPLDNPPLGDASFVNVTRQDIQTYAPVIPEGWTDVQAYAFVTTPSWILASQELTVFPAGTSYTYNPTQLARQYPNLELVDTTRGNHVADVVTLTLVMTGNDADGQPMIRTRTYTILHDTTYTTDEAILR